MIRNMYRNVSMCESGILHTEVWVCAHQFISLISFLLLLLVTWRGIGADIRPRVTCHVWCDSVTGASLTPFPGHRDQWALSQHISMISTGPLSWFRNISPLVLIYIPASDVFWHGHSGWPPITRYYPLANNGTAPWRDHWCQCQGLDIPTPATGSIVSLLPCLNSDHRRYF